jgi:hypothetical protein
LVVSQPTAIPPVLPPLAAAKPPAASTPASSSLPRVAHAPAGLLNGKLDIANAFISQVYLEFANKGLVEWIISALKDTGSDLDMVSASLVDEIEQRDLTSSFPLSEPIAVGAVDTPTAFVITHAITLPIREGDVFYSHTFGVAPLPAPPHLIMGQPWLKRHLPHALDAIANFGKLHDDIPVISTARPVYTGTLTPSRSPARSPASPLKPTTVSGGGGISTPTPPSPPSEPLTPKSQWASCLRVRIDIEEALRYKACRIMAKTRSTPVAPTTDPGVRGLTGNKDGWLDSIPKMFRQFANSVFSDEAANVLPEHRPEHDCTITLKEGATLKPCKLYDMSSEELEQLKKLLDLELQRGFIRPSASQSSAPVFFVRDPSSGTRSGQLRLVVDYRDLNSKIKLDEYPIPLTRQVMNDLANAHWITTFDVRSGFANIRMSPGSEPLTAFKTAYGLYESTVMPMGLATAPSVFQRFINSILNPYLGHFCHAYLDDVVVFTLTDDLTLHQEQVAKVLKTFADNQLRLKPHKCKWFRKEVDFLGFNVVCGKGIRMAADKIQALRDLKPPRGVSDLRSILGMFGFYDKLIPHYSDTVACLNELLRKDAPWNWTPTCQKAFDTLLSSVKDDLFLRGFSHDRRTRLSTDSSDVAYAGMIEQLFDDGWHPVLFFHHKFKDAEKNWDGPDKELYAIVFAFDTYRHFLAQSRHPIEVHSDHRNLAKFMFTSNLLKSHDGRLGRWWQLLSQCNFEIQYLPGKENIIPDFLSRYGFEASADLPSCILLPEKRFSPKALADIHSWFKKSNLAPNVREILERRFANSSAKSENQNSSPDPVPELTPLPSPAMRAAYLAERPAASPIAEPTAPPVPSTMGHPCPADLPDPHSPIPAITAQPAPAVPAAAPALRPALTEPSTTERTASSAPAVPATKAPPRLPAVPDTTSPPRDRLVTSSLSHRQRPLADSLRLTEYSGSQIDPILEPPHVRRGSDRRGIGFPSPGLEENRGLPLSPVINDKDDNLPH